MIYTCYSFKGGVGRSMAVANIAEIMYARGLRVLLIDFDLEAPGLERYFDVAAAKVSPDEIESKRGLIDLLVSYNALRQLLSPTPSNDDTFEPEPASAAINNSIGDPAGPTGLHSSASAVNGESAKEPAEPSFPVEPLTNFIHQVYARNEEGGELHILPAGQRARREEISNGFSISEKRERDNEEFARYAERVRAFPWNDFYTKWEGQRFFEWFRNEAGKFADVVLIDSRTGVTEMSGICTYHLADTVVMFSAPNKQNLSGTKMIADSLLKPRLITEGRKGRPLLLLFVPSRIDLNEKSELDEFARQFRETFNKLLPKDLTFETDVFVDLKIPYVPFYSFREEVAVRDRESPVAIEMIKVYENLCLTMAKMQPVGGKLREKYDPRQIVEGNSVEQQNRLAEAAFGQLTTAEQEAARLVLFQMVRLAQSGEAGGDTPLRVNMEEFNKESRPIVKRLSEVGLVSVEKDEVTGVRTAQFAQESFIQNWDRLGTWLNEDREFLLWRQQIKTNIEQWNKSGRERAGLLSGASLSEAKLQRERHELKLTDSENLYIIESSRRQMRHLIKNIVGIAAVLLILVSLGVWQWQQNKRRARNDAAKKDQLVASLISSGDKSALNGNFSSAIDSYQQALSLDPDNVKALNSRGKANSLLGNDEKAFADFNRALELKPDYTEAYAERGLAFAKRNDFDKAIVDLTKAISLKPDYAEAYYYRGFAYRMQNNPDAAMMDYNRALILKSDKYPEVFLERGMLFKARFEKDKSKPEAKDSAISDFRNAITLTSIPAVRSQAEDLLVQLAGPNAQPTPESPNVFIHYNDTNDESIITQLSQDITDANVFVQGEQSSQGFTTGDIRYYYPEDKGNAEKVRNIVNNRFRDLGRNLTVKLRFLGNYYKDVARGSIEVWIPSLSALDESRENPAKDEAARAALKNRRALKR